MHGAKALSECSRGWLCNSMLIVMLYCTDKKCVKRVKLILPMLTTLKKKKTISYIGHSSKCTNDAINTFWKVIKEKKKASTLFPLVDHRCLEGAKY